MMLSNINDAIGVQWCFRLSMVPLTINDAISCVKSQNEACCIHYKLSLLWHSISNVCFYIMIELPSLETSLAACSSIPCLNNATCFDSSDENHRKNLMHPDDYECFCRNGYSGKQCESKFFLSAILLSFLSIQINVDTV